MKATVAVTLTAGLPAALASAMVKPRIIGPDERTDRFKFVISIQHNGTGHSCGGMLLDSLTVLTANHCLTDTTDAGFIIAGKTDLDAAGGVTAKISTLQRPDHKPWKDAKGSEKRNDIAIIKLATPIATSDSIEYALLPKSDSIRDGSKFVAVGWGRNTSQEEAWEAPTVPKRAEALLEQQPMDECTSGGTDDFGDESTLICAGRPGKTTCSGDSGGPLVDPETGVLVGVTSASVVSEERLSCTKAAIFTRVGSYLDFINANLGEKGFDDGDHQLIKEEVTPALKQKLTDACKREYDGKYHECVVAAREIMQKAQSGEASWADYRAMMGYCNRTRNSENACYRCVQNAKHGWTSNTVIDCAVAKKTKGI